MPALSAMEIIKPVWDSADGQDKSSVLYTHDCNVTSYSYAVHQKNEQSSQAVLNYQKKPGNR